MSDTAGGRNFYYSGKFEGESDADVIERLALVNERDALVKELEHATEQLRWAYAELEAHRMILRRKRTKEYGND